MPAYVNESLSIGRDVCTILDGKSSRLLSGLSQVVNIQFVVFFITNCLWQRVLYCTRNRDIGKLTPLFIPGRSVHPPIFEYLF